jgi:putative hemolysin
MSNKPLLVDVEKAVQSKNNGKKPSRWVVSFLKKIVHQDEINQFLRNNPDLRGLDFIEAGLKHLNVKLQVEGLENIPKEGKFVFASNHPLGGLDGMSLGLYLGRYFNNKIMFLSNDLLMNVEPMLDMFIPVNKHGAQGKRAAELMNEIYESDNQLLIYPAGICSRREKGKIEDPIWQKSFITKSIQYQRTVIPVYFDARNSNFFYNLANIRKFFGVKLNVEMLFLSDEMFKQKNKTFKAYIGKPIPYETFDKSKTHLEWAQYVKQLVYEIGEKVSVWKK